MTDTSRSYQLYLKASDAGGSFSWAKTLLKWVYYGWSLFTKGGGWWLASRRLWWRTQSLQTCGQWDRGPDEETVVCSMVFKREKVLGISDRWYVKIKLCWSPRNLVNTKEFITTHRMTLEKGNTLPENVLLSWTRAWKTRRKNRHLTEMNNIKNAHC